MNTYQVIITTEIKIIQRTDSNGTVSFIPFDSANRDYQQYLIDTQGR